MIPAKNIIVRMPNWIGDLIMATPILTDLRKAYPDAEITVMCRSPLSDLLKEDPDINELFSFSKVNGFGRRSEKRNIIEKLRKGNYDLGILLTNSLSSAWWFWQGKVKQRVGFARDFRRLLLTHPVSLPQEIQTQHLVLTYKKLLEPLGIPLSATAPRLHLTPKEIQEAKELLTQLGMKPGSLLVGINPGAAYGTAKCWLPERFRELTEKLAREENLFILYFGDAVTAPLVKEICQGLPSTVLNLAGLTSIRELASLISLCDILLTNDSGPMHIASALGTPVVALFGSTSSIATGPYRGGRVIQKQVACSPCYKRVCPIDFRCMKQIEVAEVYQEISDLLQLKKKSHV